MWLLHAMRALIRRPVDENSLPVLASGLSKLKLRLGGRSWSNAKPRAGASLRSSPGRPAELPDTFSTAAGPHEANARAGIRSQGARTVSPLLTTETSFHRTKHLLDTLPPLNRAGRNRDLHVGQHAGAVAVDWAFVGYLGQQVVEFGSCSGLLDLSAEAFAHSHAL